MADTPKPYVFDTKAFEAKIEEIKNHQISTYEGKLGVNPHQWLWDNLRPLELKYNKGDKSEELFKALMALPYKDIPHVKGPNKFDGKPVVNKG